jgi:hypothetical protein
MKRIAFALIGALMVSQVSQAAEYVCDAQIDHKRVMSKLDASSEREAKAKMLAENPKATNGVRCVLTSTKQTRAAAEQAKANTAADQAREQECRKMRESLAMVQDPSQRFRGADGAFMDQAARKKKADEMQAEIAAKCPSAPH